MPSSLEFKQRHSSQSKHPSHKTAGRRSPACGGGGGGEGRGEGGGGQGIERTTYASSSDGPNSRPTVPALFTNTSTRPHSSIAASASLCTCANGADTSSSSSRSLSSSLRSSIRDESGSANRPSRARAVAMTRSPRARTRRTSARPSPEEVPTREERLLLLLLLGLRALVA